MPEKINMDVTETTKKKTYRNKIIAITTGTLIGVYAIYKVAYAIMSDERDGSDLKVHGGLRSDGMFGVAIDKYDGYWTWDLGKKYDIKERA